MAAARFIKELLKQILQDDISDDIIEYMLTIPNEEDFDEFMESIIDVSNPEHIKISQALKEQQFGLTHRRQKNQPKDNKKFNRNGRDESNKSGSSYNSEPKFNNNSKSNKSKKKYVNFYGRDHQPGLLKGRHPCQCQATKHELINNCRKCGRIVCAQECSGPCFFCDEMVCTRYEMEILQSNTKEATRLQAHLLEQKKSKEWKAAIENRNRLLKTDQMGDSIKTKIFDDENDYFQMNSHWLDENEKSSMKRKYLLNYNTIHKSRKDMKLALDFASRTVNIENDEYSKNKDKLLKGVNKLLDTTEHRFPKNLFDGDKSDLVTEIVRLMDEQNIDIDKSNFDLKKNNDRTEITNSNRIANSEFLESVDQGLCLSMHQPWASLLVAGIKIHEGRTWKTQHRGRLWIAAASKEPEDEEILTCEEMYRVFYNDPTLEFPKKYPTSCLLGCVTVDDCLSQSDYQKKYPNGESNSPYVLICSNPVILPVFYPMQGQHKIFPLNKELHKVAKAALMSSRWL